MSVFRLLNPECVFIHIPKTAGTSIRKGVWGGAYEGPVHGCLPEAWAGLFKFAFVRHPFDRLLSAWRMFNQNKNRPKSLTEFCDIVTDEKIIYDERRSTESERIRHHTIPQTHSFNLLAHADFVGRFENLYDDWGQLSARLGTSAPLPMLTESRLLGCGGGEV